MQAIIFFNWIVYSFNHTVAKVFLEKPSFLNFLFYTGAQPINNVVIVSGGQQRGSAIHIHGSILPQTPLPPKLPQNTEKSSLYYTVGACWLCILNIAVHTSLSNC